MEKHIDEMDLDEWEFLLPVDGFIEGFSHHKDLKKPLVKPVAGDDPKRVLDMNYFVCPSTCLADESETKSTEVTVQLKSQEIPIVPNLVIVARDQEDQDPISQVFFNKMKIGSPKDGFSKGIKAQIEQTGSVAIHFEEKEEQEVQELSNQKICSSTDEEMKEYLDSKSKNGNNCFGGLKIWRWKITGIGALCSLGFTAATICIFILGNRKQDKHHQLNQKIRFQIYADEKSVKQAVHLPATKLNQAFSAVRNVHLPRGHITFGGYYDGL